MKYASNYLLFVRRLLACLSCITPPLAELVFALALFLSYFSSSRVAVSPGLDNPPLSLGLSPLLGGRDDESETICNANRLRTSA